MWRCGDDEIVGGGVRARLFRWEGNESIGAGVGRSLVGEPEMVASVPGGSWRLLPPGPKTTSALSKV